MFPQVSGKFHILIYKKIHEEKWQKQKYQRDDKIPDGIIDNFWCENNQRYCKIY